MHTLREISLFNIPSGSKYPKDSGLQGLETRDLKYWALGPSRILQDKIALNNFGVIALTSTTITIMFVGCYSEDGWNRQSIALAVEGGASNNPKYLCCELRALAGSRRPPAQVCRMVASSSEGAGRVLKQSTNTPYRTKLKLPPQTQPSYSSA